MPTDAVQTFTNATLYLPSEFMGNILRIDCREVKVTTCVRYAQYTDAIHIEYLQERKRIRYERTIGYRPFIVVLDTSKAIEPDGMYGSPTTSPSGLGCRQSKYSSFDAGWKADFMTKLANAEIEPLLCII